MTVNWKYPEYIVQCEWLKENLTNKNIRIFDCTTYLHYTDDHPSKPYDVESGFLDYKKSHIPGASFIDLQKQLSDNNSDFSFTLPKFNLLAETFKNLGIGMPYHIILYSRNGMQWSSRVWWMLYVLGFRQASILDGGLIEWERLGFLTENIVNKFEYADFDVKPNDNVFVSKDEVLLGMGKKSCVLLNALTKDLHMGENPRYGRRGRIPGSMNIPFHKLVEKQTGKFKTPFELMKIFQEKGITDNLEIINYCGGGIAATLDAFVLLQLGFNNLKIYDNSMSEWAMDQNLPIEVG